MPPWALWAPLGLATLVLALIAFRYGWIAATITETDVINAYSARYLEEAGPGASKADCVGHAGLVDGAWVSVICGGYANHVNRFGGLVSTALPLGEGSI